MKNTIKCPKCGHEFEASEGLMTHLKEEASLEAEKKVRAEIEDENKIKFQDLEKTIKEKDEKIDDFRQKELELREKSRKLEDKEKDLEIETQRRVDEASKKVEEQVSKRVADEFHGREMEDKKKIADMTKQIEDLKRISQQGSMQTQGEVGELELERLLRELFLTDEIIEVKKGELGGDVRQFVKTQRGTECGLILWERKRSKTWDEKWASKLKEDMRRDKAHIGVIVTEILPKDQKREIDNRNGIWVTTVNFVEPTAKFLRQNLYDVAKQKAITLNKQSKAEDLYDLVTSQDFVGQIERMVGIYLDMRDQITRERTVAEKQWKQREMQIDGLLRGISGMYGGMQLIAGTALPQVKSLEASEDIGR